jgi:integrase/recombinase XerD
MVPQPHQAESDAQLLALWLHGRSEHTRHVLLPASVWRELMALRKFMSAHQPGSTVPDVPVFRSRKCTNGWHLTTRQAQRLVAAAAARAGISEDVSPHWLRHAHATHALERGAPIHLVKDTLGHASIATTGKYLHARPTESSAKYLGV